MRVLHRQSEQHKQTDVNTWWAKAAIKAKSFLITRWHNEKDTLFDRKQRHFVLFQIFLLL